MRNSRLFNINLHITVVTYVKSYLDFLEVKEMQRKWKGKVVKK